MADNNCKKRGRRKKLALSDDEMLEELLFKAYDISVDAHGELRFERNSNVLTLQETAFMLWNIEGRKTAKPFTNTYMIKTEKRALDKLRAGLQRYGINSLDDVFDPHWRTTACINGSTDCPE